VTGTGYQPRSDVPIRQCTLEDGLPKECVDARLASPVADDAGAFVAGVVVTATITLPSGAEVDCRETACALSGASLGGWPGVAPLTFAPEDPGPGPDPGHHPGHHHGHHHHGHDHGHHHGHHHHGDGDHHHGRHHHHRHHGHGRASHR
jgi:hypothetical protein